MKAHTHAEGAARPQYVFLSKLRVFFLAALMLGNLSARAEGDSLANDPNQSIYEALHLEELENATLAFRRALRKHPRFAEQLRIRLKTLREIDRVISRPLGPWAVERAKTMVMQDVRARDYLIDHGRFDWAGYEKLLIDECRESLHSLVEAPRLTPRSDRQVEPSQRPSRQAWILLAKNVHARLSLSEDELAWWIEPISIDEASVLQRHSILFKSSGRVQIFAPDGNRLAEFSSAQFLLSLSSAQWLDSPKLVQNLGPVQIEKGG